MWLKWRRTPNNLSPRLGSPESTCSDIRWGVVAQTLAVKNPGLVQKMILVGTAPQGGEEHLLKVVEEAFSHKKAPDVRLPLFFTSSEVSQATGRAFLKRASVRTVDRDPESGQTTRDPQAKALIDWCASKDPEHSILKAIGQPVLVLSGSDDTMQCPAAARTTPIAFALGRPRPVHCALSSLSSHS